MRQRRRCGCRLRGRSSAPKTEFILTRAEDLVRLRLAFEGMRLSAPVGSDPVIEPVGPDDPTSKRRLNVWFPPQHISEQVIYRAHAEPDPRYRQGDPNVR